MAQALSTDGAFLSVAASLTGRRWRERAANPDLVRQLQARYGLPEPLARGIAARGVSADQCQAFLRPTLKALFPDPSSFADMDKAAELLLDALVTNTQLTVFADYDVDGASSAALLVRWFRHMGKTIPVYVPDRLTEGYGPNPSTIDKLHKQGVEVLVTVDCGAAAYDAIAAASELGLKVIVIDHHLMRGDPPLAAALVNPNRQDCPSGQGVLAAAGVTLVLLAALNRAARRRGMFVDRPEPDLRRWLDIAAMGAICDVTQLVGFNRGIAALGLKAMSAWSNAGLSALMDVAGLHRPEATVFHAGFVLGPRINAGGRVGRADLGVRLLATDDPAEAADLARQLDALNIERKEVERGIFDDAIIALERDSNFDPSAAAIVIAKEGWHPGVIGIVASRLRERYRKPVVVIGVDRMADIAKGSGRSQPGVNLGAAIQAAYDEGLLLAGGGHAMAAGLTMRTAFIPDLRSFLCERLNPEMALVKAEDALDIDGLLTTDGASRGLLQLFERMAPFGPGNPEPLFALARVRCDRPALLKGGHIRCDLTDSSGGNLRAIAWRAHESELGARLMAGGSLHLAGRLRPDDWNGREGVQLEIEDAADPRRMAAA